MRDGIESKLERAHLTDWRRIHSDQGGEVEGGHEGDQQGRLDRHRHLVSSLVHDEPVEHSASAVEHRVDAANQAEELVVADEGLAERLVEGGDAVGHEDDGEPGNPEQEELLPLERLAGGDVPSGDNGDDGGEWEKKDDDKEEVEEVDNLLLVGGHLLLLPILLQPVRWRLPEGRE